MASLHTSVIVGMRLAVIELPDALVSFSKRSNCWFEFNSKGFSAGQGLKLLANCDWDSKTMWLFQADLPFQVRTQEYLLKSLGITEKPEPPQGYPSLMRVPFEGFKVSYEPLAKDPTPDRPENNDI